MNNSNRTVFYKTVISIIAILIAVCSVYSAFAFSLWDTNVAHWTCDERASFVLSSGFVIGITEFFCFLFFEDLL